MNVLFLFGGMPHYYNYVLNRLNGSSFVNGKKITVTVISPERRGQTIGEGVCEMRIHTGAGYRVYYTRYNDKTYWLLLGGDKSNQQHDIEKAIRLAKNLKETKS